MKYQVCTKCVMDTTDADISFDSDGVCNHCIEAAQRLPKYHFTPEQGQANLEQLAKEIKSNAKGKYDSVVGLSGGVDSSYVALLAKKMGLNPLCVHFDNGWNSETAVMNIKKIIGKCGFDLQTYVIDWPEFKDLQRSFFKAGVIDIEMLTDHAIMATMFRLRSKHKIKYVISGTNYTTEHGMPKGWSWNKLDITNIRNIQQKFGTKKIRRFPTTSTLKKIMVDRFKIGGVYAEPLNMISYTKDMAMEDLKREFDWQYYGGKHYESIFTKFYQAYILPTKFNVDKRKVHLSALIRNGEITRAEATEALKEALYAPEELRRDKEYVLKKLDFTEAEFDRMMQEPPHSHDEYGTENDRIDRLFKIARFVLRK